MANWVYNRLTVTGPPSDVHAFVERVRSSAPDAGDDSGVLDFEQLVPMPADLRDNNEMDPTDPHGFLAGAPGALRIGEPSGTRGTFRSPGAPTMARSCTRSRPRGRLPIRKLPQVPHADSSIDALHDELFDERPGKPGTRYERLTSLVVKILAPDAAVVHDRDVPAAPPRRSVHQIDVVVDRPGVAVDERLLIECRHHGRRIVKNDVQAHHAAALQIGAHPVLVTTVGYQAGAETYAEDEGVTLLVLRRFEEADRENRLMELAMDVHLTFPVGPKAQLHIEDAELQRLAAEGLEPPFEVDEAMLQWEDVEVDVGGRRRGLLELLEELGATEEVGSRRFDLPFPLAVPCFGEPVRVHAITWTTEAVPVTQRIVAGRGLGPPELLVLDAVGTDLNRAIFRRHLEQLAIAGDGTVVDRSRLWHHDESARSAARRSS